MCAVSVLHNVPSVHGTMDCINNGSFTSIAFHTISIPCQKNSGLVEAVEAGEVAREATPPTNPQTLHSFRCLLRETLFTYYLSDAHSSCLVQETRISALITPQLFL